MFSKVVVLFALVAIASAFPDKPQPGYGYQAPPSPREVYSQDSSSEEEPAPFNYGFAVEDEESGSAFSHKSDSDGKVVNGEYRVALPDGRTQVVKYYATEEEGYVAEVTYEGEARPYVPPKKRYDDSFEVQSAYRAPAPKPKNTYAPPPPKPKNTYAPPPPKPKNSYAPPPPRPQNTYGTPF